MRECPYCPEQTFLDPNDWSDHIRFKHLLGEYPTIFPMTWEQADAWYHAALLGVKP